MKITTDTTNKDLRISAISDNMQKQIKLASSSLKLALYEPNIVIYNYKSNKTD